MATDYMELMTTKSDQGLQEYIDNRKKYNPQSVFAAIEELKKRGRSFSDKEIETIKADLEKQEEISKQRTSEVEGSKNVVKDMDAPEYYSEKAIYTFSIGFGVLFGSILMAFNLKKAQQKNQPLIVILFGIVFTALELWLLSYLPRNTGLTIGANAGGALIINYYFWKKFMGAETKYRAKSIWTPLIVAILVTLPLLYIVIVYGQE
jgi:hypothetical protein